MMYVYQAVVGVMAALVAASVYRSRSAGVRIAGGMVLVPLLLRLFLVK